MEDFNINITAQDVSYNYSNITSAIEYERNGDDLWLLAEWIILCISLPLILVAICALFSQVRHDHVAPIYVINLLISDCIQLCCLMALLTWSAIVCFVIHVYCLMASAGFMVCVALERYLVIACPLWYRFRRTIKTSVVVCAVVWAFPFVVGLIAHLLKHDVVLFYMLGVFFLLPLPLFIFFLGGTLRVLSVSRVSSDEKRRIVGILVLALLIYTLLFLPMIIMLLTQGELLNVEFSLVLVLLSPLADLVLYVFMRKGTIDKLLASVCWCSMDSDDIGTSTVSHSSIG